MKNRLLELIVTLSIYSIVIFTVINIVFAIDFKRTIENLNTRTELIESYLE